MTDILEQLSDAKGALRSFATLKGAFSAAEAAVQAIEAARAEIAALREARDALATPEPKTPRVDATVLPPREHGAWNRQLEAARYGGASTAKQPDAPRSNTAAVKLADIPDDAERDWQAWDDEMATPDGQAKLARLATDAATVRLTRAQRELLAAMVANDGIATRWIMQWSVSTAKALVKRGLAVRTRGWGSGEYPPIRITDAGRAALRCAAPDAQR